MYRFGPSTVPIVDRHGKATWLGLLNGCMSLCLTPTPVRNDVSMFAFHIRELRPLNHNIVCVSLGLKWPVLIDMPIISNNCYRSSTLSSLTSKAAAWAKRWGRWVVKQTPGLQFQIIPVVTVKITKKQTKRKARPFERLPFYALPWAKRTLSVWSRGPSMDFLGRTTGMMPQGWWSDTVYPNICNSGWWWLGCRPCSKMVRIVYWLLQVISSNTQKNVT